MSQTPEQLALERIREAVEKKAENLSLSGLRLNTLPNELWQLSNLQTLNLSENQFSTLPPEIAKLSSLQSLSLQNNQFSTLPPEIAKLSSLQSLDLSGNQFSTLPPEIAKLSSLQTLSLQNNQFSTLPPEIAKLSSLQSLSLQNNQFSTLLPEIANLSNLQSLFLQNNQFSTLPPEIAKLSSLQSLSLSGNQFSTLPPEIANLSNLQSLFLSGNQFSTLPPEIQQLSNLQSLSLLGNQFSTLPPEIANLSNLQSLDLDSNQFSTLPPEIGKLSNLQSLDLQNNQFSTLPPEIANLSNLQSLFLQNNQFSTLPPEIANLSSLQSLSLSRNQFSTLPPEIAKLSNLQSLDLQNNQFSTLPPEIQQLSNLQSLSLLGNQFSTLPPEIGKLSNLQSLDLDSNQFSTLPPEIGKLSNLQSLDLQSNQFSTLPPEIANLSNLQSLFLQNNQFSTLPPEIAKLSSLQSLSLSGNQFSTLPPEIANLNKLKFINLHQTPLTIALPNKLLGQSYQGGDAQKIFEFYKKLWSEGGHPLSEARVLVVGQPQVGKTSLVKRLKGGGFNPTENSTMAVEMHTLPAEKNQAQVWDFGGQEHMHATHPFFFSARCVFLLVMNVRDTEEQNRLEYWLRTIRLYGKDSPIILVGNKADKNQHTLDIPKKRLQKDYPNIKAIVETSAQDDFGIEDLRQAIIQQIDLLPQVHVELPTSYLNIKKVLESEKEKKNIISLERYHEICEQNEVTDSRDQNNLLDLLHDLGTVFHFKDDQNQPISEVGILNPNWVTQGVYHIINSKKIKEDKGKLIFNSLAEILPASNYASHHRRLIMDLMKRFELCYSADESTFWLPNLMEKGDPDTEGWESALRFEYNYIELPENVLTRFIVRTHQWIANNKVWRTGVHLEKDENQALVYAKLYEKRVIIQVKGRENTRRDFLAFLRGHFDEIHQPFDPKPEAFVYHKDYPEKPILFDELLDYEKEGKQRITIRVDKGLIELSVRDLLNGYTNPMERQKDRHEFDEEKMTAKEYHIHHHNDQHVNVGGDVNKSVLTFGNYNQIQQAISDANIQSELKESLLELNKAVKAMQESADKEQAEEIQEYMKKLVEEALKQKPNQKWYRVSIEGLIEAAEKLDKLGTPVISLAKKVLTLLVV